MRAPRSLLACLLPALLLATACASTRGQSDGRFPTSDELAGIAERPLPEALAQAPNEWDVSTWTLAGPLPDGVALAPHAPADEVERMLVEGARARPEVALTEGMHCVAREVGRFYLAHETYPGDRVQSFILGRCGATPVGTSFGVYAGDLGSASGEGVLPAEWLADIEAMVAAGLPPGPSEAGIAVVREGSRVAVLLASGVRLAMLEPVPLVPDESGVVTVRGTLTEGAHKMYALVTQGRFEAVECAADPEVALPRFSFSCPVNREDELARIEIAAFVDGKVLGKRVANLLARPSGAAGERYERMRYTEARVERDMANADEAMLTLLNQVRRDAGLAPLALEAGQHATAQRLAPHFFGALAASDESLSERIVLGMMAGWDVAGVVESGEVAWSSLQRSTDLAELLAAALESPFARASLLARDVDRVALGVVTLPEHDRVAVLFGTYGVYEPTAFEEEAARAYSLLAEKRVGAGAEPPRRLVKAEPIVLELAQKLERGELTKDEALDALSKRASAATRRSVLSFLLPTQKLEELELPKELLLKPPVDVALAVAHTRDEGEAWGHLAVLVVMTTDGAIRTAAVDDRPSSYVALAR